MANCVVSTISALADVFKDELQYKTIRDLTKKKETLMTQIRRVGSKLLSKRDDYYARRVPLLGGAEECTDITKDIKSSTNSTTFSGKNCYVIKNDNENIILNKPATINGNLTLAGSKGLFCYSDLTINGNLTLTNDTQLYVYITQKNNVLIKGSIKVRGQIDAQGASGITVGGGANLNVCTLKFSGELNNNLGINYLKNKNSKTPITSVIINTIDTTPNSKSQINVVTVGCNKGTSYFGESLNALNGKSFVSSQPPSC
jgi:hypothetical protein